jgi:hypothetical protein
MHINGYEFGNFGDTDKLFMAVISQSYRYC